MAYIFQDLAASAKNIDFKTAQGRGRRLAQKSSEFFQAGLPEVRNPVLGR